MWVCKIWIAKSPPFLTADVTISVAFFYDLLLHEDSSATGVKNRKKKIISVNCCV